MFLFYLECFSDLSLPRVFGMVQDGDLRPFDFVWLISPICHPDEGSAV